MHFPQFTQTFRAAAFFSLLFTPLAAQANLLEKLMAANISATNATVCFTSIDTEGNKVPTTAVLQWSEDSSFSNQTTEQFSDKTNPDDPISGLRAMYMEGLKPDTFYNWKIIAKTADGQTEESGGSFTTLPVSTTKKRGPDGTHIPPHTPAYETPATYTASSWEEVNNLLDGCSGGEVIEVDAEDSSDQESIVLRSGNSDWEKNVLIRPPLGKRASNRTRSVEINSPHITVAGFNLRAAHMFSKMGNGARGGNAVGEGARRSFFWMCTVSRNGSMMADGCPDSGWFEVVALHRGVGRDRSQIKTQAELIPENFTVAGCWLEGKDRTNKDDHCDTIQTFSHGHGQKITGLKLIDSVFFRSANSAGQLNNLKGTLIENCWFGPLDQRSPVNGSYYATVGASNEAIIRGSDWNGTFRQDIEPDAIPAEIRDSSFPKMPKRPGPIFENNNVSGELVPQPPLPDLDAIWPK
ncbi:MAG: hypothetical protein ACK5LK_00030 [Chthoniobacterales bacterium]